MEPQRTPEEHTLQLFTCAGSEGSKHNEHLKNTLSRVYFSISVVRRGSEESNHNELLSLQVFDCPLV